MCYLYDLVLLKFSASLEKIFNNYPNFAAIWTISHNIEKQFHAWPIFSHIFDCRIVYTKKSTEKKKN